MQNIGRVGKDINRKVVINPHYYFLRQRFYGTPVVVFFLQVVLYAKCLVWKHWEETDSVLLYLGV